MRKHILHQSSKARHDPEIPVASIATILVSSEAPDHPLEHAFDGERGPGATRWVAAESGEQKIIVVFDTPQMIRQVTVEVEEHEMTRTQEIQLSVSSNAGETYRELRRQEFNFSPGSTTWEREDWTVSEEDVTHLKLSIKPDKGKKDCRASLTTLAVR
ncbi:MAG: discoidin domain-containing protein [Nitrospiraceae bacterium]